MNTEQNEKPTFKPEKHFIQIKSQNGTRDYLPVQWRLVWFRSAFPHGSIETEMLHLDLDRDTEEEVYVWNAERRCSEKVLKQAKGFAIFRAIVKDGEGGIATGTKSEKAASFLDFIEKAETGAIGRALAALGYGTQFTDDFDDQEQGKKLLRPGYASANQIASARNLSKLLNRESSVTEETSEEEARKLISELAAEYKAYQEQIRQTKNGVS